MLEKISRKTFLKHCSYFTLGMMGFTRMLRAAEQGMSLLNTQLSIQTDPNGILNLIEGFTYQIISEKGIQMSDGLKVPDYADGMASFKGSNGKIILIRNHEIGHFDKIDKLLQLSSLYNEKKYIKKNKNLFYDSGNSQPCCGGTTTLVYNPKSKKVETEYLSLAGTLVNCSGGPTPWNTWISCEETMIKKDSNYKKDHGYNFEVVPSEKISLNKATPLKAMGRFRHEAVAIDPNTNIAYQTEDQHEGLIYRFIPKDGKKYLNGGKLQALVFSDNKKIDTRNWDTVNIVKHKKYDIKWIDLDNVESPDDDLRYTGHSDGAAIFARPEGMWYDNGFIYFTCTSGGKKKIGQIWKYSIKKETLELVFEPNNSDIMKKCDNLTISPWGDMIICEDGRGRDRIIGVKNDGSTYVIAENILNTSEFAGVNFSPDGQILFVNIYSPTKTIAITGPWNNLI